MPRAAFVLPFLSIVAACRAPAPSTSAPAELTTATVIAATSFEPAATSKAPPKPVVEPRACVSLEWDDELFGVNNAKATTFKGKISRGEGQNARNITERFQTLVLEKPACDADGEPVTELQLYTLDETIDLKRLVGSVVTISGEPFAAHTAHHHRPIVVEVKTLTVS